MTRLILIRHGETDYNLESRYCGFSDVPLNNKGIWQAERLADRLKGVRIDRAYSSDLKRAYQTAKLVFKNNSIDKLSDFREMNFGLFEGLRYEEIIKEYPVLYRNWIEDPMKVEIPGGEGLKDFSERINERLSFILSQHKGETVAIITHGGPIRVILSEALRSDSSNFPGIDPGASREIYMGEFWRIEQEVGALNIIDCPEKSKPIVVAMNDVSYLFVPEGVRS